LQSKVFVRGRIAGGDDAHADRHLHPARGHSSAPQLSGLT
jgi:hypothetical protein